MKEYKDLYFLYCSRLMSFDHCTKKDVKKHNAAMDELSKLYHIIEKEPDKSFLEELLICQNDYVRMIVASHCLGMKIYVPLAEKVLTDISLNMEDRFLALNAAGTLMVWREQGYLLF